jgi:hypothetical protein
MVAQYYMDLPAVEPPEAGTPVAWTWICFGLAASCIGCILVAFGRGISRISAMLFGLLLCLLMVAVH